MPTDAQDTLEQRLREALRETTDALTKHHQWHAAQTDPDPEYGFVPADEYCDSSLYEQTVAAVSLANPLLTDGPVNQALKETEMCDTDKTNDALVKHMTERFLRWKLPDNFCPDAGISFEPFYRTQDGMASHEPTGTNLFDYTQAEAMVRFMLEGSDHAD